MKIAVDIDNVIADFVEAFLPRLKKHCECSFEEIISFDFEKNFNISIDEYKKLWIQVEKDRIYRELKPVDGANEAIRKLSDKNDVFLISSRKKVHHSDTLKWLQKYRIPSSNLKLVGSKKEKVKEMVKCDIAIEDDLEIARMVEAKGTHVILFDYPWNRIGKKISRVVGWKDALKKIELLRGG